MKQSGCGLSDLAVHECLPFLPIISFLNYVDLEMAFFSPEKLKRKSIEVDLSEITSLSPEVQKRLDRIEGNYQELDAILAELESKMASDDRLKAIDQSSAADFEATFGVKQKRKWRTPKKKSRPKRSRKSMASADPKKPR